MLQTLLAPGNSYKVRAEGAGVLITLLRTLQGLDERDDEDRQLLDYWTGLVPPPVPPAATGTVVATATLASTTGVLVPTSNAESVEMLEELMARMGDASEFVFQLFRHYYLEPLLNPDCT